MRRFAAFIVRFHTAIFWVFIALAVVCGFMAVNVGINSDMTKYLPSTMQMKQGSDIMDEAFGQATIIEVMVKGPQTTQERKELAQDLKGFSHVDNVTYEAGNERYDSGDYQRLSITCKGGPYDEDVTHAINEVKGACQSRGYECWVDTEALNNATNNLTVVLIAAVVFAMIILFVLAASWIEPLLLLFTILVAVVINLGTNLVFGEVSDVTSACGAILQMALSMDYVIMLLNRYRREHGAGVSGELALERALEKGARAIASSSVTTIAGLLCLVLMSFTIGRDMGLALAKGVFLSLVCAFAVMPALILWFDDLMERTKKPTPNPKMTALSAFSFKLRYVMVGVFVVLLALGLVFKGLAVPAFITPSKNPDQAAIAEHFDLEQQVVVLYTEKDEAKAARLTEEVQSMKGVLSAQSYATTLAKPLSAQELSKEMDMEPGMVRLVYYYAKGFDASQPLASSQLVSYVKDGFMDDLGTLAGGASQSQMEQLATLLDSKLAGGTYTLSQACRILADSPSISSGELGLMYLACQAHLYYDDSWTMSLDQLVKVMATDFLNDPNFAGAIDEENAQTIRDAQKQVETGKESFVSQGYGRIICSVGLAPDSQEMEALCTELRATLDKELSGEYWLVGKGPMIQEMSWSFADEFNFISWVTVGVIFLIVLVTFRNVIIPALLVSLIQTAFNWDLSLSILTGDAVYYVALIVVQAILMGATIDYAILYTTNYRDARTSHGVRESVNLAYRHSIRTVAMSGCILVFVCLVLGLTAGGITGQICMVISEGATASVILVLLVLPGMLAALDKVVTSRKNRFDEFAQAGEGKARV